MKFQDGKEIVNSYKEKGISLWSDNGKLRYKAPQTLLSSEDLQLLKRHKQIIIDYLEEKKDDITLVVDRSSRFEPFPMTDVQTAYLLGRKETFQYGGVTCHVYLEIKYEDLKVEKVKKIWDELINRHDMLRAVVNENGYQQVLQFVPELEIPYIDLSTGDVEQYRKLENIRVEMSHKMYTLGQWPMFGIALSKHKEETLLHFSMEFLIGDWTSIWMLLSEFESLYYNPKDKLPQFELNFRDYILAERHLKNSEAYEKDKKYWLKQIENFPVAPELPMIRQSNIQDKPRFKRNFLQMGVESWEKFKKNAQKYGITPTVAVLTVYSDVIEQWSCNKRFCINMTVLNRLPLHEEVNRVVGDFTSISLLAIDERKKTIFLERAKKMNSKLFEDLDHRLYTGIEMIRELARRKGREASIMPIVFTSAIGLVDSNNQLTGKFEGRGITQTPQVFIDCQAMDGNFGLQVNWDVREGIFPKGMIEDMFRVFEDELNELADSPESWQDSLCFTIPEWQKGEREKVNDTNGAVPHGLMHSKFMEQVKIRPEKIAVDDGKGQYTYAQLHNQAKTIASEIIKKGGKKQDKIAIVMDKTRYQVAAVLGILYMGGIFVPVDAKRAELRRNAMLDNVGANIVLSVSNIQNSYKKSICLINVDQLTPTENLFYPLDNDHENPAYIIYTSGSTGLPKGVVITHQSALNTIEDINEKFRVNCNDKVLGISRLNFDLSVYDIFGLLSVGGTIIYPEVEHYMNPFYWVELIEKHKITVWNSVPAVIQILLTYLQTQTLKQSVTLRLALLSGDWIPLEMPKQLLDQIPNIQIVGLGGATEASIWSIYHEYKGLEEGWVSIPYGIPLRNQGFQILNETLRDCPIWVPGKIYITGAGLAKGYYGDEETTKAKFFNHPVNGQRLYDTGDIGRYLPGGEIEFLGREDNQVKIRGHRIELGEIEHAINNHPSISISAACVSSEKKDMKICGIAEIAKLEFYGEKSADEKFKDLTNGIEATLHDIVQKIEIMDIEKVLEVRDQAALISMLYCLQKLGFFVDNRYYQMEKIVNCDKVEEKYRWLIQHWVTILEKRGYLNKKEETLYQTKMSITEEQWSTSWELARQYWGDEFGSKELIEYMKINAEKLVELLTGREDPVGLLYPDGSTRFVEALYIKNTMAKYLNQSICEFVKRVAAENKGRRLKILEIGAGTGATAEPVLNSLEGLSYTYYFTDITKYFFPTARKKFGHRKEVIIKELDIDRDYREQGFTPNSFDIIIGAYVLENAKQIEKSLDRVEDLLAPQGYFLFSEPVKEEPWILASQALMMTRPEDELRKDAAFIDQDKWLEVLNHHGDNTMVKVIPKKNSKLSCMGLNLFIKQFKRNKKKVDVDDVKSYISAYLPDYMIPDTIQLIDQLPLNSNGKIDRKKIIEWVKNASQNNITEAEESLSTLDNELEVKLSRIWIKTLNIESLGKKQNFYDYGADSLIMAQAATKIRNQLKVNIPFDTILRQMLNHPTIEELALFISDEVKKENSEAQYHDDLNKDSKKEFVYIRDYGGNGEKRLRVLIHGALGSVDIFHYLAPELISQEKGRVISFGISDLDKYCTLKPLETVEFLADEYTKIILSMDITRIQLIGYSFSGVVAIEMAKRLTEKGIIVEDVSIIDGGSVPIETHEEFIYEILFINNINVFLSDLGLKNEKMFENVFFKVISEGKKIISMHDFDTTESQVDLGILQKLENKSQKERFKIYAETSKKNTGREVAVDVIERLYHIFVRSFQAMHFVPDAYFGDIRYYSAKEQEGIYKYLKFLLNDWEDVCLGDFYIEQITGNHYSCIGKKENAVSLAKLIGKVYENN